MSTGNSLLQSGYWLASVLVVVIGVILILSQRSSSVTVKFYTVQSGSMRPDIQQGSLVVVRPGQEYRSGDVITYLLDKHNKQTVTHRIVESNQAGGNRIFITKGDANEDADLSPVSAENVIGKVVWHIPYLGYPVSAAKTKQGFIIMIVIPATLIIYSELLSIKKEIADKLQKRREQSAEDSRLNNPSSTESI